MRAKPDICNAMRLGLERTSRTTVLFLINETCCQLRKNGRLTPEIGD
jgi:hypothetical protein